jgi:hypothetical protein
MRSGREARTDRQRTTFLTSTSKPCGHRFSGDLPGFKGALASNDGYAISGLIRSARHYGSQFTAPHTTVQVLSHLLASGCPPPRALACVGGDARARPWTTTELFGTRQPKQQRPRKAGVGRGGSIQQCYNDRPGPVVFGSLGRSTMEARRATGRFNSTMLQH